MSPEMRTDYERAMEEYSARFKIDTQNPASPTSPSVDGPKAAAASFGLGGNDTTPTRRTSKGLEQPDLEHALDTIRKLVSSAGGMTNEELQEYLFALHTAGSKATDLATNVQSASPVAMTVGESIRRKYQLPTFEVSTVGITSRNSDHIGHRQAALNTLPILDRMKDFIASRSDGGDEYRKGIKAQIEDGLSNCQDSVRKIGATDNFFLLSENFGVLHKGQDVISQHHLRDLDLAPHELGQFDVLDAELTACELDLARKAVSTLHQGVAATDLFSENTHASRHFWGGGEELFSMSLAFP